MANFVKFASCGVYETTWKNLAQVVELQFPVGMDVWPATHAWGYCTKFDNHGKA